MIERLVVATGNAGKLAEFRALLAPLGIAVLGQRELGIGDADEPHVTFVENALAKARHASAESGLPALADDSGLCCVALGGAPGVRSARFSLDDGPAALAPAERAALLDDAAARDLANNARVARLLAGADDRRAWYVCVLALVRHPADPQPLLAEGEWHGRFVDAPRGGGGFGYDPHFLLPELGRTAAELSAEEKNRLGHRGRALQTLMAALRRQDR